MRSLNPKESWQGLPSYQLYLSVCLLDLFNAELSLERIANWLGPKSREVGKGGNYSVRKKEMHIFKNIFCCLISCVKCCMALYFNMTMPDPMQQVTSHSSSSTTVYKILLEPSMSPDLNPNKHTQNELERCLRSRVNTFANVHESFQTLKKEWVAIPA